MRRVRPLPLVLVMTVPALPGTSPATVEPQGFEILPQPKHLTLVEGDGLMSGGLHTLVLGPGTKRPAVLPPLLAPLTTGKGTEGEPGVLFLSMGNIGQTPTHPEGYELIIADGSVRIGSRGEAGLFYGTQTLQQLLEDGRDRGIDIPALHIVDWPEVDYRAVHFDVKHHLDRMQYYYDAVDRLAAMKINAVIWEFEDKLRYRRHPIVGADHAMSIEEVAALTRYARERHVEISPLVQGLGHASFILKHEEYYELRDDPASDWAFCPLNERTYEVQFELYLDAIDATPGSRYLHIGGDEVEVGATETCRAPGLSSFDLLMLWLKRVTAFATEHERIPIMWDDMPLKHARVYGIPPDGEYARRWEEGWTWLSENVDLFPKNVVYMRWRYDDPTYPWNVRALQWYREQGLRAMTASAAQDFWPLHPRNGGKVRPIRDFNRLTAEYELEGSLCTAWDDNSVHMEFYWRGWAAHAEYAWSPHGRSIAEFNAAYGQRRFGPAGRELAPRVHDGLEAALTVGDTIFEVESEGRWWAGWDRALAREPNDTVGTPLEMPDPGAPGVWSGHNAQRLATARTELDRYDATAMMLGQLMSDATRGRFALRLMSALNDVQASSWRFLLAIAECDTRGRDACRSHLLTEVERFRDAEMRFLAIFGETRFLANPPGYRFDQNQAGHIANMRNDSSWIFAIQRAYVERMLVWLGDP